MNLRPPGPQPERSRRTRCDSALSSGLSCSELRSVALNLHPRLHPRRRERSSSPAAGHALQCWSRRSPARSRSTLMRPCIGEPLRRLVVVRSERELGAVGDARVFRGAAVLPPALPDRPLLRFVRGSSGPRVEQPAGDCRFRGEAAVSTCAFRCSSSVGVWRRLGKTLARHGLRATFLRGALARERTGRRRARTCAHATPNATSNAGPRDPSVSSRGMPPMCAKGALIIGRSRLCSRRLGGAPRGRARDRRVGRGSRRRSRGRPPFRPRVSS